MGKRYWHLDFDDLGSNFRMTDMQAAVGLVQLRKLDAMNQRRIEIAARSTAPPAGHCADFARSPSHLRRSMSSTSSAC